MHWRSMRYFTRATLFAAMAEAQEMGLPDRHASPARKELSKKHRYVVVIDYPFTMSKPHFVRCVVQWAEGGLQWTVDVTPERYRALPKMQVDNPHLYRLQ